MAYKDILKLLEEKEPAGLEQLYLLYGQKLYRYAVKNWQTEEDKAWDLVYQTLYIFIKVFDRYNFESEKHFQNVLYKIFKNKLWENYRKEEKINEQIGFVSIEDLQENLVQQAQAICEDREEEEEIVESLWALGNHSTVDFLEETSTAPAIKALKAALEEVSEDEKLLLLLRANNFSYKKIGELLKVEDKHLKVKHHRAKAKLTKLFNVQYQKNKPK